MTPFLLVLTALLLVSTTLLLVRVQRLRSLRKQRNLFTRWPVPRVSMDQIDSRLAHGRLGPGLQSEVRFIGGSELLKVSGVTSDSEAWILAALSKDATLMFEFGTCTGRTTYLWAVNSPPDARVVTLTLAPGQRSSYRAGAGDGSVDTLHALSESDFESFLYTGTEVESKVVQLFGDSKALDESPWAGQCDLVFVDGSHALSYVQSDSEKALRMVKPGGLVLWHDYRGPRAAPGVFRALNQLSRTLPLRHIAGTTLVAYRRELKPELPDRAGSRPQ